MNEHVVTLLDDILELLADVDGTFVEAHTACTESGQDDLADKIIKLRDLNEEINDTVYQILYGD